jgi:hypothetical protein
MWSLATESFLGKYMQIIAITKLLNLYNEEAKGDFYPSLTAIWYPLMSPLDDDV